MRTIFNWLLETDQVRLTVDNVAVRDFPPAYGFGPHGHRFIELDLVEEGFCGMLFGGELVRLGLGDCLLIYPGVDHYFFTKARSGCRLVQLEFALDGFSWPELPMATGEELRFLEEVRHPPLSFRKLLPATALNQCLRSIRREIIGTEAGRAEMLRLLFAQLVLLLSREVEAVYEPKGEGETSISLARRAAGRLANELDSKISLGDLAVDFGVSSRYLRRCFHDEYGMSPADYILGLRIRRASALLALPSLSILDVALQSGFSSSHYFPGCSRRKWG